METNNKFYSDLATMRVLQKYDYSWEKNNYRISVGRPVDEALQVKDMVYDKALAFGFSDVKANKLANNAYSAYYDMFFHADEISETVRAKEEVGKRLMRLLINGYWTQKINLMNGHSNFIRLKTKVTTFYQIQRH